MEPQPGPSGLGRKKRAKSEESGGDGEEEEPKPGPSRAAVQASSTEESENSAEEEDDNEEEEKVQPMIGPVDIRPQLASPVPLPQRFVVPEDQMLPHQIESGVNIGNLFLLLNKLQNRIALAISQYQYLKDPENRTEPPHEGFYKPTTPEEATRDIRNLSNQQKKLMEKLRRYNCTKDGKCYDTIMAYSCEGVCRNCLPFAYNRIKQLHVTLTLEEERRKALKERQRRRELIQAIREGIIVLPRRRQNLPGTSRQMPVETPHPDSFLSQESFLSTLGLVTPEVFQRTQAESRRTERRRRTTANPKYKSEVFVDPTQVGKRTLRSDTKNLPKPEPEEPQPSTSRSTDEEKRRDAIRRRFVCSVCGDLGVTVECTKCVSGYHPGCIRVTASKAPSPATVPRCPNCVYCNPNITTLDCILMSRRTSRPSIMGQKSSGSGKSRSAKARATGRGTKGGYKRKIGAKVGKSPPPKKRKIVGVKGKGKESGKRSTATLPKEKKAQKGRKESSSRRIPNSLSLNHSLAVAAAAAVPAYCSSLSSSVESVPDRKKVKVGNRKSSKKASLAVGVKRNTKAVKMQGKDRQKPSVSPVALAKNVDMSGEVKKAVRKPRSLSPQIQVSMKVGKQSQPSQSSQIKKEALPSKVAKPSGKQQTQIKSPAKPKSAFVKTVKTEENDRVVSSTDIKKSNANVAQNKSSQKKANGLKPIDPFYMKRTMMAMSAAAGIVMNNNGIKHSALAEPQPSTSAAAMLIEPPVFLPVQLPPTQPDHVSRPLSKPSTSSFKRATNCLSPDITDLPMIKPKEPVKRTPAKKHSPPKTTPSTSTTKETPPKPVLKQNAKPNQKESVMPKTSVKNVVTPKSSVKKPATPQITPTTAVPGPSGLKSVKSKPTPSNSGARKIPAEKVVNPGPSGQKSVKTKPITNTSVTPNSNTKKVNVTPSSSKASEACASTPQSAKSDVAIPKSSNRKKLTPKPRAKLAPEVERSIDEVIARVLMQSKPESPKVEKKKTTPVAPIRRPQTPSSSSESSDEEDDDAPVYNEDDELLDLDEGPVLPILPQYPPVEKENYSFGNFNNQNNDEVKWPESPASCSKSSTIGSSRSLSDIVVTNDSSDELLSIPDTSFPYLEVKMMNEQSNPLLNFSPLDRMELLNRKVTTPTVSPVATKRGRPPGKGRANANKY